LHCAAIAQQETLTADQVISKYTEAVGGDRFSTITTLVESGELSGNLTNFGQGYRSPWQSQNKQRGTFESYFKSPNLRFHSTVTDNNQVLALFGCDGEVSWYIDASLKRTELRPKLGSEGECEKGFKAPLFRLRELKAKMRLVKKKEIEGRAAWEIKVDGPTSWGGGTYYFDAETFLLLRFERQESRISYSDYRDVGGIKLPFTVVQELTNSKLVTTLREVKINAAIDDGKFAEPQVIGGKIAWNAPPKKQVAEPDVDPTTPLPMNAEASKISSPESEATPSAAGIEKVNFPNYTSCPMAELKSTVPELKGLKVSADQEQLAGLLKKVGAKTLEIAQDTPNLISRERVIESPKGAGDKPRDYDYLILARLQGNVVGLDEFRLDLKSGEKFQTDEIMQKGSAFWDDLERARNEVATSKNGRPPTYQGFASSWVHFYPTSRPRTTYRYLGEQKRDGHRTLVVAFAQRSESVLVPAIFRYKEKTAPVFLQGIAWIDPSDFRILRLRTDLLAPVPEVSLHRMTADIQFAQTRIEQVPTPLQLPSKVTVTATVGESTTREVHQYSEYRLFRAKSRVVLNP
jgi:hypothetical protein